MWRTFQRRQVGIRTRAVAVISDETPARVWRAISA